MPIGVKRSSSLQIKPGLTSTPRRKVNTVRRSNSFSLLARPSKPGDRLTIERLLELTPYKNGIDIVSEEARNLLINCVKMSTSVHDIFFPNCIADPRTEHVDTRGFHVDNLAVALVAQALSRKKDSHKFHSMIEKEIVEEFLTDVYQSLQWKKMGFSLYTLLYLEVVKDEKTGVSIQDFIDSGGHVWAEKLLAYIMEPQWTQQWMLKIVRGQCSDEDYNQAMNELFVKLHLLDPQAVIPAFQLLLNQKALPTVNLELATRNYLEDKLDSSSIQNYVDSAVSKTSVPMNVSRLSLSDVDIFYGVEVDDFIVTECRNLGFWTGSRPDNCRISKVRERCRVM
ncbi:hypothetical protein ScPMuIL_008785 [Solemya velum]